MLTLRLKPCVSNCPPYEHLYEYFVNDPGEKPPCPRFHCSKNTQIPGIQPHTTPFAARPIFRYPCMPNPSGRRPPCPPPRSWRSTVSITGRIVAKIEFLQPGGSVKDRAAKAILMAARQDGRLRPGMPVVEMTSGNMGAGLAVVCAALGHPFVAT